MYGNDACLTRRNRPNRNACRNNIAKMAPPNGSATTAMRNASIGNNSIRRRGTLPRARQNKTSHKPLPMDPRWTRDGPGVANRRPFFARHSRGIARHSRGIARPTQFDGNLAPIPDDGCRLCHFAWVYGHQMSHLAPIPVDGCRLCHFALGFGLNMSHLAPNVGDGCRLGHFNKGAAPEMALLAPIPSSG